MLYSHLLNVKNVEYSLDLYRGLDSLTIWFFSVGKLLNCEKEFYLYMKNLVVYFGTHTLLRIGREQLDERVNI